MIFEDLISFLKKKENKLFTLIIVWMFVSFTICSFIPNLVVAYIAYVPLMLFCIFLFTISFVLRKDLRQELTKKSFIKYILITIPFALIFAGFAFYLIILIFILSVISYIFLTALFTSINCYRRAIRFDDKLYKLPAPINFLTRMGVLLGGFFVAFFLMIVFVILGTILPLVNKNITNYFALVPWILLVLLFVLLVISGVFFFLMGRFNAWLGVYFVWVGIYAIFLLLKMVLKFTGDGSVSSLPVQIALYVFDVIILLDTINSLVGSRAEILSKRIKHVKPDSILIWLIFSKVAYEFTNALPESGISAIKAVAVFGLFTPLVFLMGLYGIYRYGKVKQRRKAKKKAKKESKKQKKKGQIPESREPETKATGIKSGVTYCAKCGVPNVSNARFCKQCGAEIKFLETKAETKEDINCPICGSLNSISFKFCKYCGVELKK